MVFTEAFLNVDSAVVARAVKDDGFFVVERALTSDFLDRIDADVAAHPNGINVNGITGVKFDRQYFLTHMLAVSKSFYDYCTHPKVLEISEAILGQSFRLKAMRYYETHGGYHMPWHTDNKTDGGFAQIPGIIFISYGVDVADGEFQYIRGTHKQSGVSAYNVYPDDEIEEKFANEIVGFKLPRGSLLVYDTYGIHRAKPVDDPLFRRNSLFFQIDAEIENSEPILVNTEFMKNIGPREMAYLGFGKPAHYKSFPQTSLETVLFNKENATPVAKWLAKGAAIEVWKRVPSPIRKMVKGALGR